LLFVTLAACLMMQCSGNRAVACDASSKECVDLYI